jgi:hypothetical protein
VARRTQAGTVDALGCHELLAAVEALIAASIADARRTGLVLEVELARHVVLVGALRAEEVSAQTALSTSIYKYSDAWEVGRNEGKKQEWNGLNPKLLLVLYTERIWRGQKRTLCWWPDLNVSRQWWQSCELCRTRKQGYA